MKGTVELSDSDLISAALRELEEESGISPDQIQHSTCWGSWDSGFQQQYWHFVYCEISDLPDRWSHFTQDDGGRLFDFFWHPLSEPLPSDCHPLFMAAIAQIAQYI